MDMKTKEGMIQYVNQCAETKKWILNKDEETFNSLIDGLLSNKIRYEYQSCPCRLATGNRDLDRDLICPCNYAPKDVEEFGACYCNLYMASDFYKKSVEFINVPERRPLDLEKKALKFLGIE